MNCYAYRVRWKLHPKWKWAVSYGRNNWPSYSFWLVPDQGWL